MEFLFNSKRILVVLLIFFGTSVMAFSVMRFRLIIRMLSKFQIKGYSKVEHFFSIHQLLMFFFLFGYLAVLLGVLVNAEFSQLFVSAIFFFGAIFVSLGVHLNIKMLSAINVTTDELKTANEQQVVLINAAQIISEERNREALLETFTTYAMMITNADGLALYLVHDTKETLTASIAKITSRKHHVGGLSGTRLSSVTSLKKIYGDKPHLLTEVIRTGRSIASSDFAALSDEYDLSGISPCGQHLDYPIGSILFMPMKDREQSVIGVLQLANSMDFYSGKERPFDDQLQNLVGTLVLQAAIALTNIDLYQNLKNLFHAFSRSIATAIDERSPYTGGHINRVASLTELITQAINDDEKGHFRDIKFTDDEMEELKLAAWMHDIGKMSTPDKVIDKSTRLFAYLDRLEAIVQRFEIIGLNRNKDHNEYILELYSTGTHTPAKEAQAYLELSVFNDQHADDIKFVKWANTTSFMEDADVARIRELGNMEYKNNDTTIKYLTEDEVKHLIIRKGTLTGEERSKIEDHVRVTEMMLRQLPFPREMANIPTYAAGHHEKLNGKGYHQQLEGKKIPLQTRILAVADVLEALTARDRPYRDRPMSLSRAIEILGFMVKDEHIDPDLHKLLLDSNVLKEYAKDHLYPEQIDM